MQASYMLDNPMVPRSIIATVVRDSMLLEIAPTGIGAILACVVGFKVTSEIGYMRLYEQIDAMDIMGIHTLNYIVLPRITAAIITFPCLIIISLTLSMFGGYLVSIFSDGIPKEYYLSGLITNFKPFEVTVAGVKIIVYSFVVSSIACFLGYYFNGSSFDLSRTSTKAIIANCLILMALDYLITDLML